MSILAVGLSHEDAPVQLRERVAVPRAQIGAALDRLLDHVPEGVILSTCNRTEIYARVGHRASGQRQIARFLEELSGMEGHRLGDYLRSYWQEDAVRHLFRVAAGLDSMMIGEGQILGQVREAYELSAGRRPVGPILARLFHRALVVGKRARTETAIARNAVSVSQAAVEVAAQALGSQKAATILVVGAGKMGELTARALREKGAARLLMMNRTVGRADSLVGRLGGESWPLTRLSEALTVADVVLTSTGFEGFLITRNLLAGCETARRGRSLVVVDIAVPRDVEPAAGDLPWVHLSNVDDLREACAANLEQRRREGERVERIVDEELEQFVLWWQAREVAPTIGALVRKAELIRQEELDRTLARLGPLSERETNAINALTQSIVNKMLHEPIVGLKARAAELDGKVYANAVRELFDLPSIELTPD